MTFKFDFAQVADPRILYYTSVLKWGRIEDFPFDEDPFAFFESCKNVGDTAADEMISMNPSFNLEEADASEIAEKLRISDIPSWVNIDSIKRGQDFYWKHSSLITTILLHGSLAGGFGIPRIDAILSSTGYLSNGKSNVVFKRLVETGEMVFAAMNDANQMLTPGTEAWKTMMSVRVLHAKVRYRIWSRLQANPHKNPLSLHYLDKEAAVPINQSDMAATLLGFQAVPLVLMQVLGVRTTLQEREDFTHLWRVVGFVLGVEDSSNPCKFGPDASVKLLAAYIQSHSVYGLDFKTPEGLSNEEISASKSVSGNLSTGLIKSVSESRSIPLNLLFAISRIMLPHELLDQMGYPKVQWMWNVCGKIFVMVLLATSYSTQLPLIGGLMFIFHKQISLILHHQLRKSFIMKGMGEKHHQQTMISSCPYENQK
jgi:hypothetical protein